MMETRTEWCKWNAVVAAINHLEYFGWSVRLIVPAKGYGADANWDGYLVVYERTVTA